MLSAMTTSESFSLGGQSRCSTSPYMSAPLSAYPSDDDCGGDFCRQNGIPCFDNAAQQLSHLSSRETTATTTGATDPFLATYPAEEVPKIELETDIAELLEQLDLEDVTCDQSKTLRIDPSVLKLDFPNLTAGVDFETNYKALDEFCTRFARENTRATHHLSGGGLLPCHTQNLTDSSSRSKFCKLPDAGCISTENIFDFDDFSYFVTDEDNECKPISFLSQISPSSPLTFDLTSKMDVTTKGNLNNSSTNPFYNFLSDSEATANAFSPTNPFRCPNITSSLHPFTDSCYSSSSSPDYENLSRPQQNSFSRCSTRPASPVPNSDESSPCVSNPFLVNQASPQFFLNDDKNSAAASSSSPSSFIFAVPVFPIFQHQIADSSTQTGDEALTSTTATQSEQPAPCQSVANQLKKFMQRNNHSEYDLRCLKTTMKDLKNSGWYYENVSWQESVVLLRNTEPGTFLVRDSSDPNFLFSLSVQTSRGPTSVRLHYVDGQFRLDAEEKLIPHMPSFNSVIELVDYYIENTVKKRFAGAGGKASRKAGGARKDKLQKSKEQVWIDAQGNVYSNILLVKPLHRKEHFSTLQHLTRLAINKHVRKKAAAATVGSEANFRVTAVYESSPFHETSFPDASDSFSRMPNVDDLPLPVMLLNYLKDYPYCH